MEQVTATHADMAAINSDGMNWTSAWSLGTWLCVYRLVAVYEADRQNVNWSSKSQGSFRDYLRTNDLDAKICASTIGSSYSRARGVDMHGSTG